MNWVGHVARMLYVIYNKMIFSVHLFRWGQNLTVVFVGVGLERVD